MSYSLNEIEGLAKKAARGAGLSWGMAEEASKAVRWLASNGLPGPAMLADLLSDIDGTATDRLAPTSLAGVWTAPSRVLCPLSAGTALNDCADVILSERAIQMENVSHPLLVVPFAAWAALHLKVNVTVNWLRASLGTDGCAVWVDDPDHEIDTVALVSLTCKTGGARQKNIMTHALRGDVSPDAWAKLNALAHRTYAPATEASRLLGAGAGVSNND